MAAKEYALSMWKGTETRSSWNAAEKRKMATTHWLRLKPARTRGKYR
jgi:hypothetical protein